MYRRCGSSGLLLPAVSLGLWHNFGSNGSFENMETVCHTAFNHGITHFDLANNYGPVYGAAEENFGRILKKSLGIYRDELVISTKAGYDMWPGPYGNWGSKKYLAASLDQSLRRMGLELVDIYYHHRPDPETPLQETAGALDGIVRSGKALYVGISNYDREQTEAIATLFKQMGTPFIINQRRYSMLDRTIEKDGLKDYAAAHGRFLKESAITEDMFQKIKKLNALAAQRGQSLAQMALAWILRDGDITSVLIGASRPSQVLDNIGMIGNTSFSEEERREIDEILEG